MARIAVAGLIFGSLVLALASASGAEPRADGVGECASVSAGTRLNAVGFNHVVTLANHCTRAVSCEVWTNVDPSPHYTLRAKPGESAEIVTRLGSPSRDVQAGKACHFE